jgi:hypothetical protein
LSKVLYRLILLGLGGTASAAVGQTPSSAPAAPAAPPPPACTSPEHRQFDFWVGRWDVYRTGTDTLVAHSLIESLYAGCVIRENWMPLRGTGGGSLNSWLPQQGVWRQTWVDSSNGWAVFEGRYDNDTMVIAGHWAGAAGPGTNPLVRIRYTREEGGAVRQLGEVSSDNGQTWGPSFDFTYRPAAAAATE